MGGALESAHLRETVRFKDKFLKVGSLACEKKIVEVLKVTGSEQEY